MSESGAERAWYCLRTQTKREHLAAASLREHEGIEVLCPRLRYKKGTRRGKVWWVEPLFPGYILAKFDLAHQERIVGYANGVSRILKFGADYPMVPESFISSLKEELNRQEAQEEVISVEPAVAEGDEVEIADGPLRGMSGEVLEVLPAQDRVRIFIEFLGAPQPVEVDLFSLLLPRKPLPGQPSQLKKS